MDKDQRQITAIGLDELLSLSFPTTELSIRRRGGRLVITSPLLFGRGYFRSSVRLDYRIPIRKIRVVASHRQSVEGNGFMVAFTRGLKLMILYYLDMKDEDGTWMTGLYLFPYCDEFADDGEWEWERSWRPGTGLIEGRRS